jgi:stage II sporulation protein AA (anti-sigma F factor antagonist)
MADVRFEREDGTVVAIITGEIDMSNATSVRQQIAEAVTPGDDAVIVDMSDLSFMDSAGLHGVIDLSAVLDERRQRFLLCVPHGSPIERAIEIVGLPKAVSVHADRAAAMEAVRASAPESRPIGPTEDA